MTVVPAAVAQGPEPSGRELRETYPLHEGTPPEADSRAEPTPAGAEDRPAPAVTQPSGGSDTVPIVIAAGLALLAFAAGFGLPLFQPSSRSGKRAKRTAPRT